MYTLTYSSMARDSVAPRFEQPKPTFQLSDTAYPNLQADEWNNELNFTHTVTESTWAGSRTVIKDQSGVILALLDCSRDS